MRIGIPKEIKNNENRVGLLPYAVLVMVIQFMWKKMLLLALELMINNTKRLELLY